jgi:predicted SnoaL-like aldol condensation-catalyzing enzyme
MQHNLLVADGKTAYVAYFTRMAHAYPDKQLHFKRVIAKSEYAVLHCLQVWPGEDTAWAGINILKLDHDSKTIEYWDVLQVVPANKPEHVKTFFYDLFAKFII